MVRAFCWPHAYTFNEQSKTATALTPQTDVTSEKVTWLMENPRQQSRPAYRKLNWLKTNINIFFIFFYFSKSQTSDSFVNHFDGHFAYLKTLDFSFNKCKCVIVGVVLSEHGKKCDTAIFCQCHTVSLMSMKQLKALLQNTLNCAWFQPLLNHHTSSCDLDL